VLASCNSFKISESINNAFNFNFNIVTHAVSTDDIQGDGMQKTLEIATVSPHTHAEIASTLLSVSNKFVAIGTDVGVVFVYDSVTCVIQHTAWFLPMRSQHNMS